MNEELKLGEYDTAFYRFVCVRHDGAQFIFESHNLEMKDLRSMIHILLKEEHRRIHGDSLFEDVALVGISMNEYSGGQEK